MQKEGVTIRSLPTNGGIQKAKFINEPNLYRLITHSKLVSAEKFEKWVFEEVLPSIRKHETPNPAIQDTGKEKSRNQIQLLQSTQLLGKDVNVYGTSDEPLFLAKNVAEWIEHSDVSMMIKNIDNDEKLIQTLFVSGQKREYWFLTEDGLYEVLMQSRKPIAKQFKKEVKTILKNIRRHGAYMTPDTLEKIQENPDIIIQLATALKREREQHLAELKREKERHQAELQEEKDYSFKTAFDLFMQTEKTFNAKKEIREYKEKARGYLFIADGLKHLLRENNIRIPGNLLLYREDYDFLNEKDPDMEAFMKRRKKR